MHQEADECSNIYTHPPLSFPAHPTSAGRKCNPAQPKRQAQKDEECHEMIIFATEMAIAMVVCVTGRQVEIGGMKDLFQAGAKKNRQ